VDHILQAYLHSPKKSTCCTSLQLGLSVTIMHRVLHKCLKLSVHKVQTMQFTELEDQPKCAYFTSESPQCIDEDNSFLSVLDVATFLGNGSVNLAV
jgi:hypothetical protein